MTTDAYSTVKRLAAAKDVQGLRRKLEEPLTDRGISVHGLAAHELGELGSTESAPDIARLLQDPDWRVRTYAGRALMKLRNPAVSRQLIEALDEENDGVLVYVMRALGRTRDPEAVDPLARIVLGHESDLRKARIRAQAAAALGETRHVRAVAPLANGLHDPSRHVRRAAVMSLSGTGLPEAREALGRYRDCVTQSR
jgi:HEAT repeat protein